ncbi:MAG: copper amine oxidase N-terminal domain-containing protein [Ruminococcaceae bacterium]|nr:copper amine oxidase N-terminal domain-containing protein [Oscillospiraceae bacterium]
MNTKKWIALSMAVTTLMTGTMVFAEENAPASAEDMIIEVPSNNPDIMLIDAVGEEMPIAEEPAAINGGMVEGVIAKEGLFPVRQIAEGLGYTVNWDGEARRVELFRGAHYITMDIDVDAYTFARRAPEALGTAPVIIEDRTYVPRRFVEEYLGAYIFDQGEDLYNVAQPAVVTISGVEEDGALLVEDEARGEVLVRIGEDTEILAGGEVADAAALEVGMTVSVIYGSQMTMSIPPQTVAVKIIIG